MPTKQSVWSRNYNEKSYDRISIVVPRGRLDDVKAYCAVHNDTVNGLVNTLLRERLGLSDDEWKHRDQTEL
jgi:NRPS condensation-like uncharacterized protein